MKAIRVILILAALVLPPLLLAGQGLAQTRYLEDLDDVPLAQGLTEERAAALVFDKPAGRIVEAEARGLANADEVRAFYARNLPQLGWQALGPDSYLRGGEVLSLSYSQDGSSLVVHYTLQPE